MRLALLLAVAAAALAGCGASGTPPQPSRPDAAAAAAACPATISAIVGPRATTRVVTREPALTTCAYAGPSVAVRVTFDEAPQAWFRWKRAEVERTQTSYEWSRTPGDQPRDVPGVSAGAFWVPRPRQLIASDGRRLLTVTVRRPGDAAAARRLAARIAPAGLGPPHVPQATGP